MAEHTHVRVIAQETTPELAPQARAGLSYEKFQVLTQPAWLQKPPQRNIPRAQGVVKDRFVETLLRAVSLRFVANQSGVTLDAYGQSIGLERLTNESDEAYRARLANAFETYRYAGTLKGLTDLLELQGYDARFILLRSLDETRWAEFAILLKPIGGASFSFDVDERLRALVYRFKPAHTRLAALRISDCPTYGDSSKYGDGTTYCASDPVYSKYADGSKYGDGSKYLPRTQFYI